ncbi:MAG: DEAD/DEAH box helicase [Pseudohongiellaceae bacterium]
MPLTSFHPACRAWFEQVFGAPTATQTRAWPAIQAGMNTLIAAPTGSGKTLAAFYTAINELIEQGLANRLDDRVQVVYVSPLKALGNDIHRNLEVPLNGIAEQLHLHCLPPVDIRVAVRTGDTPQQERQRMARNPPHILVTTPESLYLLLTSRSGRQMLGGVQKLIVDEIHAMLGDKRGSHLALSVERLEALTGKRLQRIGLSATQKPVELVARFLVGNRQAEDRPVDCCIIDAGHRRKLDVSVEIPGSPLSALMSNEVWEELYQRLVQLIDQHQTTLVFVNTRRLSERLALALGERLEPGQVSSHHGSMSKDHRHQAEQRLKAGDLKVLVATASMELGIDIGAVDLVVQFSSPKSIATFLQRVGRSGHSVTGTPKGILFPLTRDDLVECTALLQSIREGELDRIVMPEAPIDILCQQIVAEVAAPDINGEHPDGRNLDELYALFTAAYPYRNLDRNRFLQLVTMLAEGYTTRRGRRGTLLHLDLINNIVRPRRGSALIALTNGGAIPDMFDYQVVLDPEDIVVGSLNEDFALEALPGDVFTLGSHSWQLLRIEGLKVRVRDAQGMAPTIPFWFGEGPGRTRELSESVSRLRSKVAEQLLEKPATEVAGELSDTVGISRSGALQLVEYLDAGLRALGTMPTRETIVMERFFDEVGDMHVVIHSPFGSRVNRGWGLALRKRFCRSFNFELQAAANEDSIVISLGSVHSFPLQDVYAYLNTRSLRDVLVQALLDAPMFEVRWRWNATRSLAIQRNRGGKRVPPQFQRMDAEDLVAQVFPDQIACFENIQGQRQIPDHPLVQQTINDCLTEAMDIGALTELIGAIERDELELVALDLREPSPFAQEIINARPYAFLDDAPFEERRTNAIRNRSWLDPAETENYALLDAQAIDLVKQQAWPDVTSADELHDALLGIGFITESEMTKKSCLDWSHQLQGINRASVMTTGSLRVWLAAERVPQFKAVYADASFDKLPELPAILLEKDWSREEATKEIIRGRLEALGPITADRLAVDAGLDQSVVNAALIALEVEGFVFQGHFTPVANTRQVAERQLEWCERRLLQRIHRLTIETHRKSVQPVSLQAYMCFVLQLHQVQTAAEYDVVAVKSKSLDGQTQLQTCVQLLDGIAAPAGAWEADILPSRIVDYDPGWLDVLCISGRITWGRYGQPVGGRHKEDRKRSGPIKSTPVILARRENLDLWRGLAALQTNTDTLQPGNDAALILDDLNQHGASFIADVQIRTGLLKSRLEQGLAELVSLGLVTSDSFTGLRALLTPSDRKPDARSRRGRKAMFGIEDAGRWSLLKRPAAEPPDDGQTGLNEEQLERLALIYLQRWGVVFRRILERESFAPPWRSVLRTLRRMELKGLVRGGRFIAGVGGEQFAFSETVDQLRKTVDRLSQPEPQLVSMAATDPLNLFTLMLPDNRLTRLVNNRVLFENGVPVAVLQSGEVSFLTNVPTEKRWRMQQVLLKRPMPPRLRSYLGR